MMLVDRTVLSRATTHTIEVGFPFEVLTITEDIAELPLLTPWRPILPDPMSPGLDSTVAPQRLAQCSAASRAQDYDVVLEHLCISRALHQS